MTLSLRADAGGTYGAIQVNGVDALPINASGSTSKIQPITASVAANALTLTLNPTILDFRSSTLSSGTVNTRIVGTSVSVVVPSTATLGTVSAVASRLCLIAIDNAGTVELAVTNLSGDTNLDESGLISTTAISTAADLANVVYSTTARTNVPFRVVGFVNITEATAGTWATAPTTIQGVGGLILPSIGANSLSANGYQKLPGGLIVQWGSLTTSGGGASPTFPIAFPNACLNMTGTARLGTGGVGTVVTVVSYITTGANVHTQVWTGGSFSYINSTVDWIAIGY